MEEDRYGSKQNGIFESKKYVYSCTEEVFKMKKVKKLFPAILFSLIIMIGIICCLRLYNDYKYGNEHLSLSEYFLNATDIHLYPTNIDGVHVKYIDEASLQGFHLTPDNKLHNGVIICYGGSEGSPNFDKARRLAEEGYETLAVFMFGMKNQQKTLVRIPLEQFEDVLKYVKNNIEKKEPITVLGASKGAEYTLNLATKYEEISNIILIAPSAYNFSGLDFNNYGSSWTWKNEEVPFIDIKKGSFFAFLKNMLIPMITKAPIQYKKIYDSSIKADTESAKKLIPVKNIKANVLMIVGEDDQMWGSYDMACMIKEENKNAILCSYKNAGHIFAGDGILNTPAMRIMAGGNSAGNKYADLESRKVIDDFLKQYHGKYSLHMQR